ncbi:MAG: ABC transporter permease [Euzebyales bacterium]|nr:ABC transporter permease [Euzebyales bacterium]
MTGLTVVRLSLKEAVRRRLLLAGIVLSVAFVVLFWLGFSSLYGRAAGQQDRLMVVFAGGIMTVLGLYVVQFLGGFASLFLSVGAVSSEIDSGTLHAVLARPLSRASWLLQRWLAFAVTVAIYTVVMGGALLLIARGVAGYQAVDPLRALGLLVLEVLVLLSLGLLGSTLWSTLANGAVVFSLFGLAWLAGIIEFAGDTVGNTAMRNMGIAVSLLVPSDALWRGASYYLQSPAFLGASAGSGGIPFAASAPPSPALIAWSLGYVAVLLSLAAARFTRRDL